MSDASGHSYPATYQRELSPTWLRHAAVTSGTACPDPRRPFRYLELGCGRGYSTLIHALSHPHGEFHACDRDAHAIAQMRSWVDQLGVRNVHCNTAAFDDASLRGLPRFDFVVAHGVYTWVSDADYHALRTIVRDCLAPGGLAYVSYNCLPGWASELPLARLLRESACASIEDAVESVSGLHRAGAAFFAAHPTASRAVMSWAGKDVGYLAHEYLARNSSPIWSCDLHDDMANEVLRFAGSATLRDNHEALLYDEEVADAVAAMPTARTRAMARDFAVNRSFRRDLFAHEDAIHSADATALDALVLGCVRDPAAIGDAILVPRGRVHFRADFIAGVREVFANGGVALGEAAQRLAGDGDVQAARRNLQWLTAGGSLAPFALAGGEAPSLDTGTAQKMLRLIADGATPPIVASPAAGGGCPIDKAEAREALRAIECGLVDSAVLTRLGRLGVWP